MSVQHDLQYFGISSLFHLFKLGKRTGTVIFFEALKTGEKITPTIPPFTRGDDPAYQVRDVIIAGSECANLCFEDGECVGAFWTDERSRLTTILKQTGKLTDTQLALVKEHYATSNDKTLAKKLVDAGYMTQEDITAVVKQHNSDVFDTLFEWEAGFFRLDWDILPGDERILVPLGIDIR